MAKYRSRQVVEGDEWRPGKQIDGVHELRDGRGLLEVDNSEIGIVLFKPPQFQELKPGDFIVTRRNEAGRAVSRFVADREAFLRDYEEIA